uniref:Uncharacterized protein n=1 Tax=Pararge aegeria TaxID=116150 RepID=S4P5X1_9NEOP
MQKTCDQTNRYLFFVMMMMIYASIFSQSSWVVLTLVYLDIPLQLMLSTHYIKRLLTWRAEKFSPSVLHVKLNFNQNIHNQSHNIMNKRIQTYIL